MTKINSQTQNHVVIGSKALAALNKFLSNHKYNQYFIVCDENTIKHCLPLLISNCNVLKNANVFEIEAGEHSKVLEVAAQIWQTLIENKAGNDTLLINLGGGVVSDLGGFCASVYKRGIDFVNVPTSLLAMADASVGSKTAIDFNGIKNIIGSFYQPFAVFIEPLFLITLPNREMKNGLAEIIKMALIKDKKLWSKLNNLETGIDDQLIKEAINIKSNIVKKDPLDKGIRKSLNYGHSMGHAIEALSANFNLNILHGEAVIMGMIIENHISYQKKMLSQADMNQINQFLSLHFKPVALSPLHFDTMIDFLNNDKKNKASKWQFSLLEKIGSCKINVEVKATEIKKALQYYIKLIR